MKILIISSKIDPPFQIPRAFRTIELAKELSKRKNEVTLYIGNNEYDYSEFARINNLIVKKYGKFRWSSRIIPSNSKVAQKINAIFLAVLMNLFRYPEIEYAARVNEALKNETEFDLLISIASPHAIHWGCTFAKKKNPKLAKLWIADCGDPFMGDTTNPYPRPFYFKYIEKWFCKEANYITVPIQGAIKGYYKEFHHKIRVIPQGFNLSNVITFNSTKNNKILTFAYAGTFIKGIRDPKPLMKYLTSKNYNFRFVIFANNVGLVNEVKELYPDKIEVRNSIARDKLIYELGKMDFLLNFDNGTDIQMPSKLIDYSLTGTPVLNIYPGEINNIGTINEFMVGNYRHKMNLPDKSNYDIENVADKFLALANK